MDLSTSLDEPIAVHKKTQGDVFRRVDDLVQQAVDAEDPLIALEGIASLTGLERLIGLGKAKLLWELKAKWNQFKVEEEFTDFVIESTGICRETVDRYILVWAMYEGKLIPDKVHDEIMGRTMRDQVEIAKIADRAELDGKDWNRIAATTNGHELAELKREILDIAPRKSGLVIRLRRNGNVEGTDSEGHVEFGGYLEVEKAKTNPVVAKMIKRITRSSGILIE